MKKIAIMLFAYALSAYSQGSPVENVARSFLNPDSIATILDKDLVVHYRVPNVRDTLKKYVDLDDDFRVVRGRKDILVDALERYSRFELILKKPFKDLGLDEDYASLVLNETNFLPLISPVYAGGPFQLISALARRYDAVVNRSIDERNSIVISSKIAAEHIFALEHIFLDENIVKVSYILGPYGTAKSLEEALGLSNNNDPFFTSYSDMVKKHNYANDFHILGKEEFEKNFDGDYNDYLLTVLNSDYLLNNIFLGVIDSTMNDGFIRSFFDYYGISVEGAYKKLVEHLKNNTDNNFHSPNYPLFNEAYLDIYNNPEKYGIYFDRKEPIDPDDVKIEITKRRVSLDKMIDEKIRALPEGSSLEARSILYDLNWHVMKAVMPKGIKFFYVENIEKYLGR